MISPKTAYRLSLLAGLILLALVGFSATQKEPPVCGNLATNYAPIIAFELARSVSDLHAIFGESAGPCRTAIADRMDYVNSGDSLVFIPAYGAFLVFFFLGLRSRDVRLASVAISISLLACAADYVENASLFHLSANPDVASNWLSLLMWATEVKWVGLGVVNAIAGYVLLASDRWLYRFAIVPCTVGTAAGLITIQSPALAGPYLSQAIALGWVAFLLVDLGESFDSAPA
jgi:hypothetical protein